MLLRLGLVILVLTLAPPTAAAQVVVGRVLDAATGAAVPDATVSFVDARGVRRAPIVTDSAGSFQLDLRARGDYTLRVEHLAYATYVSDAVELNAGETVELTIHLGRSAIPLTPLVVTARSARAGRLAAYRERLADGPAARFVTREEIEKRATAAVSDLLRSMASVHIVPARRGGNPASNFTTQLILLRGNGTEPAPAGVDPQLEGYCNPSLLLDGVPIRQSASFPVDDLIAAQTLEGIEVYTTPGAAPIELRGTTSCGVVALWTQEGGRGTGRWSWRRNAIGLAGFGMMLLLIL